MNETDITGEIIMRKLIARKSPGDRLAMGCSMFMFSKTLVRASLEREGAMPINTLRQQLFIRFYGEEFEDSQKNKILKHLGCVDH